MLRGGLNNLCGGDVVTSSEDETRAFGFSLGQQLKPNSVVCFFGDLGAGKTTMIQGLVAGATGRDPQDVNSPTFVYLNIHQGPKTVYHFDLYRLHDSEEFLSMGFDDFFYAQGICCIEWSEKIAPVIPAEAIRITLKHAGEHLRKIVVSS